MLTDISEKWLEVFNEAVADVGGTQRRASRTVACGWSSHQGKPRWRNAGLLAVGGSAPSRGIPGVVSKFWMDDCHTCPTASLALVEAEVWFGGTPVRLVVDCVYTNGTDLIVVDYKTGQRVPYGQETVGVVRQFD